MKTNIRLWSYIAQFFSDWDILHPKRCRENQNTFCFKFFFLSKIVPFIR